MDAIREFIHTATLLSVFIITIHKILKLIRENKQGTGPKQKKKRKQHKTHEERKKSNQIVICDTSNSKLII